jgi:hypothetical protein
MIEIAERRACSSRATALLDFRVLPTENSDVLENEELFDGAFSNFSGLNCVDDLPAVAQKQASLLRPGASLVLCVVGRFVPLEIAWADFAKHLMSCVLFSKYQNRLLMSGKRPALFIIRAISNYEGTGSSNDIDRGDIAGCFDAV